MGGSLYGEYLELQDHEAVLDLKVKKRLKICSEAKTLIIEITNNFKVCLKLSPYYFIFMKFQLFTYSKYRIYK